MSQTARCAYCDRVIPNFIVHPKIPKTYHAYENPAGEKVGINKGCWALSDFGKTTLAEQKTLTASAR